MSATPVAILFFFVAFLVLMTLYYWYVAVTTSPKLHLKRRLRGMAVDTTDRRFPAELRVEILGEMGLLDKFLFMMRPIRSLDRLIDNAGYKNVDVKSVMFIMVLLGATGFFLSYLFGMKTFIIAIITLGAAIAPIYVLTFKRSRRIERFTEQFPDALDMISRSLKAGHALSAALQMVGSEMPEPTGGLFKVAYEEQALGLSMREAIDHMAKRIPGSDVRFFVMATNVHREVGGNLGEILERLAKTIRERLTIRRQVKVYSAQAKLSGVILVLVPPFMALLFYFALPGYLEEILTVDWGLPVIYFAIIMQIIGWIVIRRIVDIKI
jgi:tight adherence protein B